MSEVMLKLRQIELILNDKEGIIRFVHAGCCVHE